MDIAAIIVRKMPDCQRHREVQTKVYNIYLQPCHTADAVTIVDILHGGFSVFLPYSSFYPTVI